MLKSEALWIKNNIEKYYTPAHSPLLNLGSSTLEFRTIEQPYIDELVLKPLLNRNAKIIHTDLKEDKGVDLAGDIYDMQFQQKIKSLGIKSIICTSLLEQVNEPYKAIDILIDFLQKDGIVYLTVPHIFPYHNDPIDNMFRPSPDELSKYIESKGMRVIEKEMIQEPDTFFSFLINRPKLLFITIIRLFTPFYKPRIWWYQFSYLPFYFTKFKVTAIVAIKQNAGS